MPAAAAIVPAVIGAGATLIGGQQQANATNNAANQQAQSQAQQLALQQQMHQQMQQNLHPYLQAGGTALNSLQALDSVPGVNYGNYAAQVNNIANQMPGVVPYQMPTPVAPELQGHADLQNAIGNLNLDNDQVYQASKDEILNSIAGQMGGSGKFFSSEHEGEISRNLAPLINQAYARQLGDLERTNANLMTNIGLGNTVSGQNFANAQAVNDIMNNAYQQQYQAQMTPLLQQLGITDSLYNAQTAASGNLWNNMQTLANMGQNSAANAAQASQNYANQGSATMQNTANNLSEIGINQGANNAQMWNQLGAIGVNGVHNYNLYNQLYPQGQNATITNPTNPSYNYVTSGNGWLLPNTDTGMGMSR